MIKAAASIVPHFSYVSFSIAGDVLEPDYFAELQALVRNLNLSGRFQFVGGVADLQQHLSTADISVPPSPAARVSPMQSSKPWPRPYRSSPLMLGEMQRP